MGGVVVGNFREFVSVAVASSAFAIAGLPVRMLMADAFDDPAMGFS